MTSEDTILITGGAGYIGAHVNKMLNESGYRTMVFDSLVHGHREFVRWGDFVEADLASSDAIRDAFRSGPIAAVIHFAAFAYVGESVRHPSKYYRNNVVNTLNLLDVMREFGTPPIVFSSTCATYGLPDRVPIVETTPQLPVNPYGRTKLAVERIIQDYASAYSQRFSILRYFNAAGADGSMEIGEWHEPETHLIPLALAAASDGVAELDIFGTDYDTADGTCVRDYVHVTDLASAHVAALEHLLAGGRNDIWNVGSGRGYSVMEVIESVSRVTGRVVRERVAQRREGDPPVLLADTSRIKEALGWSAVHSELDNVVRTAWNWHRKLPELQRRVGND